MKNEKKYKWHKIAYSENELVFPQNNLLQIDIDGEKICLAKANNALSACAAKCPHAAGIMADGFIDALGNIICPLHRYRFNLSNGRDVNGEGYFIKIYPLKTNNEGLFIGIEEKQFGFF